MAGTVHVLEFAMDHLRSRNHLSFQLFQEQKSVPGHHICSRLFTGHQSLFTDARRCLQLPDAAHMPDGTICSPHIASPPSRPDWAPSASAKK